ncbi:AAA family ATPase [Enterovibrio baiacu]|uniref:AAA family ATPase n=1 Tax=Enterovibrio baiacu TaxID=2491023 RepID=UPI00101239DA|nr:ATP-binding protein [Enterovibrio baiacu]MBE1275648.1 DUF2813 domain-containing protein [Enterovibrio baiacu]
MLREIELIDWKSYRKSTLYFDPLTVLIGTNSSGKSNILDALQLLNRLTSGLMVRSALSGDHNITGIRGGLEWAFLKPSKSFRLKTVSSDRNDLDVEYHYSIEIEVFDSHPQIKYESLQRIKYRKNSKKNPGKIWLFKTEEADSSDPSITARLYNERKGSPRQSGRGSSILSQLSSQKLRKEIQEGINIVTKDLNNVFILDPIPSHMRGYSLKSETLEADASNVAGVIAAMEEEDRNNLENKITKFVKNLPEKDIERVYAETVGRFDSDAMLYCDERWADHSEIHTVDARGMSDGTLRFIAIITALLTRPQNSVLIVEEIDNGLHPSRASILVDILKEISLERNIDILITTHNPALLDAFGTEIIPFVSMAHRDPSTGESKLILLEDIDSLPKLLANGKIGVLSTKGALERAVREETEN